MNNLLQNEVWHTTQYVFRAPKPTDDIWAVWMATFVFMSDLLLLLIDRTRKAL